MSQNTAPHISPLMGLEEQWIDYNGHLNMAYYNVLFDRGCDTFFEEMGLGPHYIKERNLSFYTAEAHIRYARELHLGDQVRVSMQIVDYDEKRIHAYAELHHQDGWLSATSETMSLHVDMSGPKVAPFPDDIMENIKQIAENHGDLPSSQNIGRRIEIKRK
ncbi:MAG: thioesterase [Rhizobiaceae bacterium]|nr:thioesterase [Rhizobiaceae bacterium]